MPISTSPYHIANKGVTFDCMGTVHFGCHSDCESENDQTAASTGLECKDNDFTLPSLLAPPPTGCSTLADVIANFDWTCDCKLDDSQCAFLTYESDDTEVGKVMLN